MYRLGVIGVCVLSLCSSCAWLFQDHLPSEYNETSEPMCSTSNGWATVDGLFAAANGIGLIVVAADNTLSSDYKTGYAIGAVAEGLIHIASAISGSRWASECRSARITYNETQASERRAELKHAIRERHDDRDEDFYRREDHHSPSREDGPKDDSSSEDVPQRERRLVTGKKPLWCATSKTDRMEGRCFVEQQECGSYRSEGSNQEASDECAETAAGSCFNFTVLITGERKTACAPSIAACETLLANSRRNVDYQITAKQCGIYRVSNEEDDERE